MHYLVFFVVLDDILDDDSPPESSEYCGNSEGTSGTVCFDVVLFTRSERFCPLVFLLGESSSFGVLLIARRGFLGIVTANDDTIDNQYHSAF